MNELPRLPPRPPDSHKGLFGLALIVGGSRGMAGAAALAGMSALRSGAGLVRVAVPDVCQDVVAAFEPSYMVVGLPSDADGRIALAARAKIVELAASATVVALGPGLGRSEELDELVGWLYANLEKPMVVDADGLNALAATGDLPREAPAARILTPHPGEFARLPGGRKVSGAERQPAAIDLAAQCGAIVVLKGHETCVTDGRRSWVNATGNPGMATGGTGDVLTGVITALACQGLEPYDAARLGVHVHGLAGDLAAKDLGQVSLIASDLVRHLPAAFRRTCNNTL
jgi:ADP-dependent NAD(P)H-hydrate dehydratase